MNIDQWEQLKNKVLKENEVLDHYEDRDEDRREDIEVIEFISPLGRMKLEWLTRPKVLDKKTSYSNRVGSQVSVDIVYSEDEITRTLKVYNWDDENEDWQEMDASAFS
ncbi:MAG: hypothetical protein COU22_03180 [Candidatus Komeilibacteria bacterium CG10_big_fil_rev_8_21_14_0_10_41_13]|uniref:Uncharacterized protein n=1 Tax=Candidatus Komeilibacteria bacterium CG10_big_fil_rev_8_21_14_0_10_41_13 TaxID=1974476 RepID=A0A2M6WBW5_9BACT|nr:MAG: hypothetical protein COU22_03180 [Candidatus Komeilibacteria bacterium CG10_big_fil_rev_8_21_14_0_10_41_13]